MLPSRDAGVADQSSGWCRCRCLRLQLARCDNRESDSQAKLNPRSPQNPAHVTKSIKNRFIWQKKFCGCPKMRERHIARAVNPLTLARLLRCVVTKSDAILAREYPLGKADRERRCVEASVRT